VIAHRNLSGFLVWDGYTILGRWDYTTGGRFSIIAASKFSIVAMKISHSAAYDPREYNLPRRIL